MDSTHTIQNTVRNTTHNRKTRHITHKTGHGKPNTQHIQTPMDNASKMNKYTTHKEPPNAHNTQLTATHVTHCTPHRENYKEQCTQPALRNSHHT